MKKHHLLISLLAISLKLVSQSDSGIIINSTNRQTIEAEILYSYSKSDNSIKSQLMLGDQFCTFYDNSFINCVIANRNDTLKHIYPDYMKWCFSYNKRDCNLMVADSMYYFQTLNNFGHVDYFSNCFYEKDNDTNHIYISFNLKMIAINYCNIKGESFVVIDKPIDFSPLSQKQEKSSKLTKLKILYLRQYMSE